MTSRLARVLPILAAFLLPLLPGPVFAQSGQYLVDGPNALPALATQLQTKTGGVHKVRFKTYQNLGAFVLPGFTADSLIFERAEESAEVVEFSGTLFKMENVTATVVFRNLAFKAKDGAAILINGRASPNRNLLLDSCQLFGDTFNAPLLSWLGDTSAQIKIRRSIVTAARGGSNAEILLNAPSVRLEHCYLNFAGLVTSTTSKDLLLSHLTANRVQFKLNGDGSGLFTIRNNLFAHPPGHNRLSGKAGIFPLQLVLYENAGSLAQYNARFPAWAGFDNQAAPAFGDATNSLVPAFADTTALWAFPAPDSLRGHLNPPGAFPAYTVLPGDTALATRLSPGDSLVLTFPPAAIPRAVSVAYDAAAYPSATDSTRPRWRGDTVLKVQGPVAVASIAFPAAAAPGRPLLFARADSDFLPGPLGPEGASRFVNALPSAKTFLPAFAGQNTFKGASVEVRGFGDTTVLFSSISRTGRTALSAATLKLDTRRWRILETAASTSVSIKLSTTAEGMGDLHIGLPKAGASAFLADSLAWWLGGAEALPALDSADRYWLKAPFAPRLEAILVEKLAVVPDGDTLPFSGGRLLAYSARGHQLGIDSAFAPDPASYPDMSLFTRGYAFSWPGRAAGDSLLLVLRKTHPAQKAFLRNGVRATPIREDSASLTLALGPGDSAQAIFLARQFGVAAGIRTDLTFGPDSVLGLLSSMPGDLRLDTLLPPLELASASLLAGRSIHLDALQVDEPFTLVLAAKAPLQPDSVRTLLHNGMAWIPGPKPEGGGRYVFAVTPDVRAVAVVEGLGTQEIIPKPPATPAGRSLFGDILRVSPNLTGEEKASTPTYRVDLVSVDLAGRVELRHSDFVSVDSGTNLTLVDADRFFAYRVAYRSPADRVVLDSTWIPLDERPIEASALQAQVPTRKARFKHLVGLPFSRPFADVFPAGLEPPKELSLKTLKDGMWTPLATTDNPVLERGRGYLFGATSPFQAQLSGATLPGLEPATLRLDGTGWHLISNPFPFPIREAEIQVEGSAVSKPLALARKDTAAGNAAEYEWIPKDTLEPFEGYLIYAHKAASLLINPLAQGTPLARMAASGEPAFLELNLADATRRLARMAFFTPGHSRPTPYFPPLEGRVEMIVGGDGGYLLKPEVRLDSIETELEIRSDRARTVSLVRSGFLPSGRPVEAVSLPEMLLIDRRSGQVYRHGDLDSIEVGPGSNVYTLITGDPGTLDLRADRVLATMPRTFFLSQNYPNPFRGHTEIRFHLSRGLGRIVQGRVDVLDLSGRLLQSVLMQDLRIGTHTLRLGSREWQPGIYVYRLTVRTELGTHSRQKRMLVQ